MTVSSILLAASNPSPDTPPRDSKIKAPVVAPSARRAGGAEISRAGSAGAGTAEIKQVVTDYIKANKSKGAVHLRVLDNGIAKSMAFRFVKIHDPVTKISDTSYLACSEFKAMGKDPVSGQRVVYDIDFWLERDASGHLAVQPARTEIHQVDGKRRYEYKPDGTKVSLGE